MLLNRVPHRAAGGLGRAPRAGLGGGDRPCDRGAGARAAGPLAAILWGRDAQSLRPRSGAVPCGGVGAPQPALGRTGLLRLAPLLPGRPAAGEQGGVPVDWRLPAGIRLNAQLVEMAHDDDPCERRDDRTRCPRSTSGHGAPPLLDDPVWSGQLAAWSADLPRPTRDPDRLRALGVGAAVADRLRPGHPLVYDFGGFEPKYYRMTYATPDATALAERVAAMMPDTRAGAPARLAAGSTTAPGCR